MHCQWLTWHSRYKLNICESRSKVGYPPALALTPAGDVGGQKTLRSYWKNYFEKTDTLVWVVDATDRLRVDDCREELAGLLLEEVWSHPHKFLGIPSWPPQRLMGASLLVFLNKTDVEQCMTENEVREVRDWWPSYAVSIFVPQGWMYNPCPDWTDCYAAAPWSGFNQNS